jgi:hypothetical protein
MMVDEMSGNIKCNTIIIEQLSDIFFLKSLGLSNTSYNDITPNIKKYNMTGSIA